MRTLSAVAVAILFLSACGRPPTLPPGVGQKNSGDSTLDSATSLAEQQYLNSEKDRRDLLNQLATLQSKQASDSNEYTLLGELNTRYCERLDLQRQQCLPSLRILPDPNETQLACERRTADDPRTSGNVFKAKIENAPGLQFKIIADSIYESNVLTQGTNTIVWTSFTAPGVLAPRLYEIKTLRLKVLSGTLPPLDSFNFQVTLNDAEIFNRATLSVSNDPTYYNIKTDGLRDLRKDPVCRITPQDLDDIRAESQQSVASSLKPIPTVPPSTTNQDTVDKVIHTPEQRAAQQAEIDSLRSQVDSLKVDYASLHSNLERERDRDGKLSKELLGGFMVGCWARQKVSKLEIILNGTHLEDGAMFTTSDPMVATGSPAQVLFDMGQNIKYTVADEEKNSVIRDQGNIVTTDYAANHVGDIEYISVTKGGVDYRSTQHCWQSWLVLKECEQQNVELKRYRLDSVQIKVNDQILYQRDGLNATLSSQSLSWEDKNFAMNGAYQDLMIRDDCPVE